MARVVMQARQAGLRARVAANDNLNAANANARNAGTTRARVRANDALLSARNAAQAAGLAVGGRGRQRGGVDY